ncbi:MAG: 2-oxoacid:ferredoxin oxidoreductase subunit beta [Bdellovibrionales bacterium]|nr:2-oxoacid:ferredoxin oxidoreductase subunit beta [Bdellovibrionales bacterium]
MIKQKSEASIESTSSESTQIIKSNLNKINLSQSDYVGGKSTLCTGCGHDSVTQQIIKAYFQSGVNPFQVVKISGIGCSSKTPAYLMNQAHGFNTIHGRMAPIATGVKVANHHLQILGISGDGDTASIGLGSFIHMIRRNLPIIYIVENNGVYGLTKGQFSATADAESIKKGGERNLFTAIDLCSLALELGCSFVARSFSGDSKQLVPLIDAAIRHNGTALIDVISPCITFANHEGSTKSYDAVKSHNHHLQELGFVQPQEPLLVDYEEGSYQTVKLVDGSVLILKKIESHLHDITDLQAAKNALNNSKQKNEILTGLFYWNQNCTHLIDRLHLSSTPLVQLTEKELRPKEEDFHQTLSQWK